MLKYNNYIHEGLIKSYDIKVLINSLENLFEKYDRPFDIIDYDDDVIILKTRDKTWKSENGDNDRHLLNGFINILRTTGWYINTYDKNMTSYKTKFSTDVMDTNFITLNFSLVKIYDKKISTIPPILYHVTGLKNIDKIKKQGLVPKSKNKIEYHLDRVYLTSNYDIAEEFLKILNYNYDSDDYTILTINTNNINNLKLYYDPTYYHNSEENYDTFYTYDNIPPYSIKYID